MTPALRPFLAGSRQRDQRHGRLRAGAGAVDVFGDEEKAASKRDEAMTITSLHQRFRRKIALLMAAASFKENELHGKL